MKIILSIYTAFLRYIKNSYNAKKKKERERKTTTTQLKIKQRTRINISKKIPKCPIDT